MIPIRRSAPWLISFRYSHAPTAVPAVLVRMSVVPENLVGMKACMTSMNTLIHRPKSVV